MQRLSGNATQRFGGVGEIPSEMWKRSLSRIHKTLKPEPSVQGSGKDKLQKVISAASSGLQERQIFSEMKIRSTYAFRTRRPAPDYLEVARKSFNAHFKRRSQAILDFEERSWGKLQKESRPMTRLERITTEKSDALIDFRVADSIHAERFQTECRGRVPGPRYILRPERSAALPPRAHVFFWG
jgi:hypothetical protein